MRQTARITNRQYPTCLDVRSIAFVFLGVIVLAWPPNLASADGVPADFKLEIQALAALNQDATIAPLNLSVQVRNRVAHLSGAVPTAELRRKAISIVENVPRILEANTKKLIVTRAPRNEQRLTLPLEDEKPTETRSASPGALATRDSALMLPDRPKAVPPAADSTPRTVALLAPEAVASPPRGPQTGQLTANPRPRPNTVSLDTSIDRLRQSDRHYRAIRSEVQGATVRIFTGDTPGEHVMAFARAVARIPGVARVVLKDTSSRPH
jgi:hypothetical protein